MAPIAFVIPIKKGKTEKAKELAKTLMSSKAKEFAASEKRIKTSKESWFIVPFPDGDMLVVYFEAANLKKAFDGFMKSKDKFDVWFKKQMQAYSGINMEEPGEGSLPEQILSFGY